MGGGSGIEMRVPVWAGKSRVGVPGGRLVVDDAGVSVVGFSER